MSSYGAPPNHFRVTDYPRACERKDGRRPTTVPTIHPPPPKPDT